MSTISAAAITEAGYQALVAALAAGSKVFPRMARVSATAHTIDWELGALTDFWWEGEIALTNVIDANTYEARVIVPPDQAANYMRTVGIYLEDGTLFAVSAAKSLPPGVGQELIIQLTYSDIVALTDFQYLSYDAYAEHLEFLSGIAQLGNAILDNAEAIGLLRGQMQDDGDVGQAITELTGRVSENETDITALNNLVAGAGADISALESQVAQNTADISDLLADVENQETIGGQTIVLGLKKVIDRDLTLTCSPGSGADFNGDGAIQQALAELDGYGITGNVVIQLADGVYGYNTRLQTINLTHPDFDRIHIIGNRAVAFSLSNASVSYSNNRIVCSNGGVVNAASFAPGGNYQPFTVIVDDTDQYDGVYTVVSATDNGDGTVTVNVTEDIQWFQAYYTSLNPHLYFMPANRVQLLFAANQCGFTRHDQPGRIRISGVSLWGNTSDKAFSVRGPGAVMQLENVIIHGFNYGLAAENFARINAPATGFENAVYINGCANGIWSKDGGGITAPYACISYAGAYGVLCKNHSTAIVDNSMLSINSIGFHAEFSHIYATGGKVYSHGAPKYETVGGLIDRTGRREGYVDPLNPIVYPKIDSLGGVIK